MRVHAERVSSFLLYLDLGRAVVEPGGEREHDCGGCDGEQKNAKNDLPSPGQDSPKVLDRHFLARASSALAYRR